MTEEPIVVKVYPRVMYLLVKKHKLDFFKPGDTITEPPSPVYQVKYACENWPWYWRVFFWLRLVRNRRVKVGKLNRRGRLR